MKNPIVSVLMPVYNGEKYLREAIKSILLQTFKDFEFIIINDASTDTSEKIIASYTDPRIRYFKNLHRLGTTKSLNHGIRQACGTYIARMDADDISLPDRFAKQVAYLDTHPLCSFLATRVNLIDSHGIFSGFWKDDIEHITGIQIKKRLPASNCIAHASVMVRTSIIRKYRYNEKLRYCQDYELWLRFCVDGRKLEKINEPLHCYRVGSPSFTTILHNTTEYKQFKARVVFLSDRLRKLKFGIFEFIVAVCICKYALLLIMSKIKHLVKIKTRT